MSVKNICIAVFGFGIFVLGCTPKKNQKKESRLKENIPQEWHYYRGDINKTIPIVMILAYEKEKIFGKYFYTKYLEDIDIEGEISSENIFSLVEFKPLGEPAATFKGRILKNSNQDPRNRFSPNTPLEKEILLGTYHLGEITMPFYLFLESITSKTKFNDWYNISRVADDSLFEDSVRAFLKHVELGEKEEVANYINYPIEIREGNGKKSIVNIKNKSNFITFYDDIFSKWFKDRLAESVPHYMFVNSSGIMISNGAVWFGANGKVIGINNVKQ